MQDKISYTPAESTSDYNIY